MSLKLVSFSSGSKGNAALIMSDSSALLVDAGISYTHIAEKLRLFGLTPSMLDGVVITHEHIDHIKGLARLSKECKVYAHPLTMRAIYAKIGEVYNVQDVDDYENGFNVGDIAVEPFRTPHDAVYSLAYSFRADGGRCSVATDIGVPTHGLLRNIRESEVCLLEANHDVDMLRNGDYPLPLKNRILSDRGHLSNDATAKVVRLVSGNSEIRTLILGHISENNNTERLAYDTVARALRECNDGYIELKVASQRAMSEVFEIK